MTSPVDRSPGRCAPAATLTARSPSAPDPRPPPSGPTVRSAADPTRPADRSGFCDSKPPATPDPSTVNVMWASSKPNQRWVSGNQVLYVASLAQNRIRSQCAPPSRAASARRSSGRLIGVEHPLGQRGVGFGVDADGTHRSGVGHHGAAETLAVRQAADDAFGPTRLTLVALEDRHGRDAELDRAPGARSGGP